MMKLHILVGIALLFAGRIVYAQLTAYELEILNYRGPQCASGFEDALFTESKECTRKRQSPRYQVPSSPGVRPSGNNRAFVLLEPMDYEIGSTKVFINIPAGFVTDYASVPKPLWGLYSPHDQYSRAAIIHDYLYWTQHCTRLQADNLFMIAMKESEVDTATREAVYAGVRLGGESSWDKNGQDRKQQVPRVVPPGRRDFPPNWSWEMYQMRLVSEKVKDPPFKKSDYCLLGNSTDVPNGRPNGVPTPAIAQRPVK